MITSVLKMQRELVAVTEERDRLAAELRKLREQEPVAMISQNDAGQISIKNHDGTFFDMSKHVGCQFYAAPVAAPAAPAVVFLAHNNNSKLLFAVREEAERFAASCGPAAGVAVTEYAVIGSKSAQQATAISVRLINALKEMKAGAYKQLDHGKGRAIFIDSNIAIDIADALLQSAEVRHD